MHYDHKYQNAKNCWHFNIYKHDKHYIRQFESIKKIIFQRFRFCEHLKYPAQLI